MAKFKEVNACPTPPPPYLLDPWYNRAFLMEHD